MLTKVSFSDEMVDLVDEVFSHNYEFLDELSIATTASLIKYFDLHSCQTFLESYQTNVPKLVLGG